MYNCSLFYIYANNERLRRQTLPPIEQRTIDEHRVREREVADFASKYWPRPEPPQPSLIHLSLTARTHDPSEFQRTFPELYSNFFVDQWATAAVRFRFPRNSYCRPFYSNPSHVGLR